MRTELVRGALWALVASGALGACGGTMEQPESASWTEPRVQGGVYTSKQDFELGALHSVNHDAGDQLQLDRLSATGRLAREGDWTVVHDGRVAGARWGSVYWNTEARDATPPGTRITAQVRAADDRAELERLPYAEAQNGVSLSGVSGRWLEVKVTLSAGEGELSPTLTNFGMIPANNPPVALCQAANVCASPVTCTAFADINHGSYDPDHDAITLVQNPPGPYPIGSGSATLTVSDATASSTCGADIFVNDCYPPDLICPAPQTLECTSAAGATADPGPGSATDCTGATVTGGGSRAFPFGSTAVTYTATDGAGNTASCATTVTVVDTTPPTIVCPPDVVIQCGASSDHVDPGHATATDLCSTPVITEPGPGSYPVGTTLVTHTATDAAGLTASCQNKVTVSTGGPLEVSATGAGELWPPDHRYVRLDLLADCGVTLTGGCGAATNGTPDAAITCVSSDEAEDSGDKGDGHTLKDIVIVDATHVDVRAERYGAGDGRVYQIGFQVKDATGNVVNATCQVGVPHSGSGRAPVDSGAHYTVCRPGFSPQRANR